MLKWSWLIDVFFKVKCQICGERYFKAYPTCPNCTQEMFDEMKQTFEKEAWRTREDDDGDPWVVIADPINNPNPYPYSLGFTEDGRPVISPDGNDWWYVNGED